ncbi:alpha/beta hydrolase [Streptomyces yaizuensis]|uniref:Alpha/beta hydrolase n=1 Tax=Streptomyces yaizuensis TaxID=2989713 RepID=A0ABQ5P3U2_9ACTN|nr:alpha/beta hydrolase [Streptomyces sp. YSPA8]GLF97118.1 alpha/beta hydrolase [Streptomyces sp. YSPA8]
MRSRGLIPLLALGVLAPLAPQALAAPAPATTTASASTAEAPLKRYESQKPQWKRCGEETPARFQCATVEVPLDYKRPGGPRIDVEISRLRTSVPDKRRGVLLFNPGGPGGSGLGEPLLFARDLPRSVLERYDLIGFDPRGLGRSSPLDCGLTGQEKAHFLSPYKPETEQRDIAVTRSIADKCRAGEGDRLPHITTRNTARDMDIVRAVLGEKKISYVGVSYGTYLGAVYTQMFPRRADRFVLDSAVDPKRGWRKMMQVWSEEAGPAFTRWSEWTARRGTVHDLGDTPAEVRRTFWELVRTADRKPITLHGQKWDGDAIRMLRPYFFDVKEAAERIAQLRRASLGLPAGPPRPVETGPETPGSIETTWSVICGDDDKAWPRDTARYRADAIRDKARYPLFGDFTSSVKPCAFWGKSAEPVTEVDNRVPSLILQNEWDSQTPYSTGLDMHKALKGSRLVSVKGGEGHGIYNWAPNPCAVKVANTYLATGELPKRNVTCVAVDDQTSRRSGPAADRAPKPVF